MKNYIKGLIIFMILATFHLYASTSQYNLLTDVGTSARMVRLGGVEGFSSLANNVFENPAGLYRVRYFSSSVFTTRFMNEVSYYNLSAGMRLKLGMVGVGLMGTVIDGIPNTREVVKNNGRTEFEIEDYFNYMSWLAKGAYQFSLSENVHMGASFSYFYTQFGDAVKGKGYNGDVGLIIDSEKLEFSMSIKNIIPSLKVAYTDTSPTQNSTGQIEPLPLQTFYGVKYKMNYFNVYGQLKTSGTGKGVLKSVGVEFTPPVFSFIHFSGGYKQTLQAAQAIEGDLFIDKIYGTKSMGIGLDLFGVSFDYAFESIANREKKHYLKGYDQKHYFSMALSF